MWVRTYRDYLIRTSEIEAIGIGHGEDTDKKTGKSYGVYVVRIRTRSGATYDYEKFLNKAEAKEALNKLFEEIKEGDNQLLKRVAELTEAITKLATVTADEGCRRPAWKPL
jgi:uncharacterized protein (DUF2225 family)